MICPPCHNANHMECTNPDTCPCQHRRTIMMDDNTVSPQSERNALRMVEPEAGMILEEVPRALVNKYSDGIRRHGPRRSA